MINKENGLQKFLMLNFGCLVTAIPAVIMFAPIKLPPGGLMSVSMMICEVLGLQAHIGEGAFLLNIPLLIISLYIFGKGYFAKTAYASLAYPTYVMLLKKVLLYTDMHFGTHGLLVSILVGGAIQGVGIAIAMAAGASTGGTDIIAQMLNHFFPKVTIGVALAMANGVILGTAALVFGATAATSGVGVILITSFVVDISLRYIFKIDHF